MGISVFSCTKLMRAVQNNCSSTDAFNSEIALKTSKELQLFWTAHINFVQDNANIIGRHKNWNILLFEEGLKIYGHVKSHLTKHWHGGASFAQKSDTPHDAISVSMIGTQMLSSLPQFAFAPTCVCPTQYEQYCI